MHGLLANQESSEDDMSVYPKLRSGCVLFSILLLMLVVCFLSALTLAQDNEVPKVDVYTGYQWIAPGGRVPTAPGVAPGSQVLQELKYGGVADLTYNFGRVVGLSLDYGVSEQNLTTYQTLSVGPRFMWRRDGVNPFIHAMVSMNRLTAPGLTANNGIGAVVGAGVDIQATRWLGIRLGEVDYVWGHHDYSDLVPPQFPDLRRPSLEGVRATAGFVWNFGYPQAKAAAATCSVQPADVMVGEPITATANASGFNPKHTLTYTWSSTGGKITGNNSTASIDTNGIAGGSYTATAHIVDPKVKGGEASCSATFTVREPAKNPPTMSCSANPSTVQPGGNSTITCTCTSPDRVPVTVGNWSSTRGSVSGMGSTATLNTSGASPGPITVSATCTDSRGLTTASTAQVTVEAPPTPPPTPQASKLSQCDYPNPVKPWRVDNTCKAILDDVAKNLQQNADSRLVIVGNAEPTEKRKNLAAERAVDAKAYLTGGEAKQGIDPSRIETRTGSAGSRTAEFWIVPAGATFSGEGTHPVDEMKVKAIPDHPHVAAKKKAKPAAQ
jgi:hypothetical protein